MDNQSYYIEIDGEQIPVTEEVYRAYKRPLWAERKRQQRTHEREADLSVEKYLDDGLEAVLNFEVEQAEAEKLLLEQLTDCLTELEPDELDLVRALFYQNKSMRDYGADLGVSHVVVSKRWRRIRDKLSQLLAQ